MKAATRSLFSARNIEQVAYSSLPPAREARPYRVEQTLLLPGERRDVAFASQPFAVRMPAHDTGRRARRIDENPIEASAIPPASCIRRIGDNDARAQVEPREILRDALEPRGIDIERHEIERGELGQVRGLAAGRGAHVEHAHAIFDAQQRRGELRAGILDHEQAFGVTRQAGDDAGLGKDDPCLADRARGDALRARAPRRKRRGTLRGDLFAA